MYRIILFILLSITASQSSSAESGNTENEINYLLNYISQSTCSFTRNGKTYPAKEAQAHIMKKYEYVNKRGLINATEDFIKYAATKSSFTGTKYTVNCAGEIQPSADWLNEALNQYREQAEKHSNQAQ